MAMSNDALRVAHVESVKSGESAQVFADRIGMKLGSINQRINSMRGDLRDSLIAVKVKEVGGKPSDEQLEKIKADVELRVNSLIPLRGRKGERKGERKEFLNSLVAQALSMQLETVKPEETEVLETENPQL